MSESSISSTNNEKVQKYKFERGSKFSVKHNWSNETTSITKGEHLYFLKNNPKNPGWLLVNREGYVSVEASKQTNKFWVPEDFLELTVIMKKNSTQPVPRERRSTLNS